MPQDTPAPGTPAVSVDGDALLSDAAAQASASVLGNLARMKQGSVPSFPLGEGQRTLESMVLELIRPMLKEWLDKNLPTLVEHVVQKEIKKITRDL